MLNLIPSERQWIPQEATISIDAWTLNQVRGDV